MGRLSPLDGIGPREIGLERLIERARDGITEEVILATNFTAEGEATAHYAGELPEGRAASRSPGSPEACQRAANWSMWTA